MVLNYEEIKKIIKDGKSQSSLSRAVRNQDRVKFHTEISLERNQNRQVTNFLSFVRGLLPLHKYNTFCQLMRFPLITTNLTSVIFDNLSRIFDGRNPVNNYQFTTTEQKNDWEIYRKNRLFEPEVFKTKGWQLFKTEYNSILVVDLPEYQKGNLPEPYFYWLPIDRVKSVKTDGNGKILYLMFVENDSLIVIDELSYRKFKFENNEISTLNVVENQHNLGYCPACFFVSESVNVEDNIVKVSPITKVLEQLDWYLFFSISKRNLDLYGAYPIYSTYETECDYKDEQNGDYCEHGFIKDAKGAYRYDENGLMRCPRCNGHNLTGAGSLIEVPVPTEGQDLSNPVTITTIDKSSLDYNVAELERLKNEIITSVVGVDSEIISSQALNEKQVEANFESKTTVLSRIKTDFEQAQRFVDETICRLRYGNDFISADVNYGTEFYTSSIAELRKRYKDAKENGASEAELDAMQQRINETEYRNDKTMLTRATILSDLEPYRHYTREEVLRLADKGIINGNELRIKLNFSEYIKRFEREQINVIDYGYQLPYSDKIKKINQILNTYANEKQ